MEFSSDSHYFIMKNGKDVVLYNRIKMQYERWIFSDESSNKISLSKSKDGLVYDIGNHVQKLEFQIPSPKVIKLQDGFSASSWVEKYGPSSFFESNSIPELKEINGRGCGCSEMEVEVFIEEFIPPRVDEFAKSYVLGRLKKHVPPKIDEFAKSYVLGRLKKHIPPKVDNFAKSFVLGRLKKHIPPKVDNFARSYMMARISKHENNQYSTLYWKINYILDAFSNVSENAIIYFRNDLPIYVVPAISKEDYIKLELSNDLMDMLFSTNGIVKAGCDSYRIYIEKSNIYFWEEVVGSLISNLSVLFRNYSASELPGSGLIYTDPDSLIRKYFNGKSGEVTVIKNNIPAGSPKPSNELVVKVPSQQNRDGQIEKVEPFIAINPNTKRIKSKINYKYNPNTRKWYKEVSNPKTL